MLKLRAVDLVDRIDASGHIKLAIVNQACYVQRPWTTCVTQAPGSTAVTYIRLQHPAGLYSPCHPH